MLLSIPLIEVNAKCSKGNTALHSAVEHKDEVLIRKLIDKGAHLDVVNNAGKTIFHLDFPDLVKILKK